VSETSLMCLLCFIRLLVVFLVCVYLVSCVFFVVSFELGADLCSSNTLLIRYCLCFIHMVFDVLSFVL
jgi:hypothetical protein